MTPQQAVATFNDANPVGTMVKYWRMDRRGEPSGIGHTRCEAVLLAGHTPVVWIDGCSGCIALSHVEVMSDEEIRADHDKLMSETQELRLFLMTDGEVGDMPRDYTNLLIAGIFEMTIEQIEQLPQHVWHRAAWYAFTVYKAKFEKSERALMRAKEWLP